VIAVLACTTIAAAPKLAFADEGGVSFWLPGFFGSLAAAPQQPGWSLTSIYYHTSVSAGADVARAREFETGRIPVNLTANVNASLQARADLGLLMPTYTFATPVFGGQLTVGAIGIYGRTDTSLAGSVTGALATPPGTLPFSVAKDAIPEKDRDLAPRVQRHENGRPDGRLTGPLRPSHAEAHRGPRRQALELRAGDPVEQILSAFTREHRLRRLAWE